MASNPRDARGPYQPVARGGGSSVPGVGAPLGSTAAEFAQARFGGSTRVQSSTLTLTPAVAQVLAANPRRVFWTIINRGIVSSAVDLDPAMTFANGILLGASGGFVQSDVVEDGESVAWPLFGACESGTCVLRILEVSRV